MKHIFSTLEGMEFSNSLRKSNTAVFVCVVSVQNVILLPQDNPGNYNVEFVSFFVIGSNFLFIG